MKETERLRIEFDKNWAERLATIGGQLDQLRVSQAALNVGSACYNLTKQMEVLARRVEKCHSRRCERIESAHQEFITQGMASVEQLEDRATRLFIQLDEMRSNGLMFEKLISSFEQLSLYAEAKCFKKLFDDDSDALVENVATINLEAASTMRLAIASAEHSLSLARHLDRLITPLQLDLLYLSGIAVFRHPDGFHEIKALEGLARVVLAALSKTGEQARITRTIITTVKEIHAILTSRESLAKQTADGMKYFEDYAAAADLWCNGVTALLDTPDYHDIS